MAKIRTWPAGVIKPVTAETSGYRCLVQRVFLRSCWISGAWEARGLHSRTNIPERREDGSGIRRKVDPQRQAECKVKRDASCDCNSGRIHFPVPLRTDVRFAGPCSGWNLGCEDGSLKP